MAARPPWAVTSVGRAAAEDFALWGEFLFPRRKRNQNAAGGGLRWASPPIVAPPGPPFTGVIPIPFHRSSGAQNTAPSFDSFRATGPWCGAKFWPAPFHRCAWFRPAVAESAGRGRAGRSRSHESGTGGSQTRPPILLPQRLDLEQLGAPVWSSCPGRLDFGATAAAARLRGQSLSFPRLTVTGSPPELGPRKFRGSGGERTGAGGELVPDGDVSLPRRSFGFFPIAGKETRPAGRNPVRRRAESSRPTGVIVHGRRASQSPAPTMFQADHSKNGQRAHAVRPYGGSRKSQQRRTAFCGRLTAKTNKNRRNFSRYFTAIFRKNSAL